MFIIICIFLGTNCIPFFFIQIKLIIDNIYTPNVVTYPFKLSFISYKKNYLMSLTTHKKFSFTRVLHQNSFVRCSFPCSTRFFIFMICNKIINKLKSILFRLVFFFFRKKNVLGMSNIFGIDQIIFHVWKNSKMTSVLRGHLKMLSSTAFINVLLTLL